MKTATLTGDNLNRAVAMALGHELVQVGVSAPGLPADHGLRWAMLVEGRACLIPDYAGDIALAWPIMVANKIALDYTEDGAYANVYKVVGMNLELIGEGDDLDPLVACMRAFVHSVLGDDVELPS